MADRSILVRLRADVSDFKRQMGDATGTAEKMSSSFDKNGRRIETAAARMVRSAELNKQGWTSAGLAVTAFGVGSAAALMASANAAIEWETAWTGVLKTVDASAEEYARLEKGLRDLATTLPVTHREVAAVAENAGQLGVAAKDIVAFTRVMVDLGNTTNLSADEAATSIAQMMNVMQTAPNQVSNLGSALVDLGNHGASTERDIILMAQRIAGAGDIIGLTEAQVLGLANALASVGIDAEAGGSAVSNIMIDMAKAVNTGSDELTTWAKIAGKSVEDFKASFKSDPAGALADVIEGLGRMNDAGQDVFSTLDALGQSDVRVTRALLSMASSGDLLRDSLARGTKAWEDNNALAIEAGKRYDTTAAKLEIARNQIHDVAITIGDNLLPFLASAAERVADVAQAFDHLPGPVKGAAGGLLGIASALALVSGGLLLLLPRLLDIVNGWKEMADVSPKIATGFKNAGKAAGIAAAAFAALELGNTLANSMQNDAASIEKTTAALLAMGATGDDVDALFKTLSAGANFGRASESFDGISDAMDRVMRPANIHRWNDFLGEVKSFGSADGSTQREAVVKQFDAIGNSLASLVESGHADIAAEQLQRLYSQIDTTKYSIDDLKSLMPAYTDALAGADNQQQLATDSADGLTTATSELSEAEQAAADALQEWRDALADADRAFLDINDAYQSVIDKNTELAQSTADATKSSKDSWKDYYDGQSVSADEFIAELQRQVDAQAKWEKNLKDLSKRANTGIPKSLQDTANAMIDELIAQGPAGAAQVKLLAGMSDDDFEKVVKLWGQTGQAATEEFTKRVEYWRQPVITPTLNLKPAQTQYFSWLNSVTGGSKPKTGTQFVRPYADGGRINGVGTSRSDSNLIAASVGEHMWDAAAVRGAGGHDAVDTLRALARSGQLYDSALYRSRSSDPIVIKGGSTSTHEQRYESHMPMTFPNATFADSSDVAKLARAEARRKQWGGRRG